MPSTRDAYGFRLLQPGRLLERCELPPLEPAADEVVVEVVGCGVCHTDVAFAYEGVPTRKPPPLVLGHEICGRVIAIGGSAAADLEGRAVIVPAVIPCGDCPACAASRVSICRQQFMPGNDGDGGMATHVRVPARGLCPVPEPLPPGIELDSLSLVADAVTTAYQAIRRSGLTADDVAVFVGAGGVGGFGIQIAADRGAAVVALDVDPDRLALVSEHGADLALDVRSFDPRQLRARVRDFAAASGRRGLGLKVFETSGVPEGQTTAFSLLDPGGHLSVVGFTPRKIEIRLSNLMAFDATARGNWGCPPEHFPAVLDLVLAGRLVLEPFLERHALELAPEILRRMAAGGLHRRPVLVPGNGAPPEESR